MGFLNKVLPAEDLIAHATAYARNLADTVAPGSARETKHQIYRDLHRGAAGAVIEAERLLEDMIRHPDYGEGVKAWMEKRAAPIGEASRTSGAPPATVSRREGRRVAGVERPLGDIDQVSAIIGLGQWLPPARRAADRE